MEIDQIAIKDVAANYRRIMQYGLEALESLDFSQVDPTTLVALAEADFSLLEDVGVKIKHEIGRELIRRIHQA